jgi:DNA-binding beta-propeller fold protein YncE
VLDFGELGLFVGDMSRPKGVAIGGNGRIYVVESFYDHLLIFDPDGKLLLPIGGSGREVGQFYLPAGVWAGSQGRVFVADMFNGRVVVLAEQTGLEVKQ